MTKSRAVRILVVLIAIPIFGAVAAYLWINAIADRRWAEAEERIRQLSAAFPEGDARHVPEHVTQASKDNQIHFVAAIRLAAPKRNRRYEIEAMIADKKTGEAVDAALDEADDFLDRLHQGARRIAVSPSDFPPRWHGDWDYVTLGYMMRCGILRALRQRAERKLFDAAETLLDSLQLARFWAISGKGVNRIYALQSISPTLDELRDLLSSETLSPDDLRRFESELEPLDDALQSPIRDIEPALARWAEALGRTDLKAQGLLEGAPYRWRFLLPARLMKAEAFEFEERKVQRLLASESKPYLELVREARDVDVAGYQSKNPIIRHATIEAEKLGWNEFRCKAEIRLLRAASRYQATGELTNLGDPYGNLLLHAEGSRVKFWSVGDDGHDDGGDAGTQRGWRPPRLIKGMPAPRWPKDIVIEVPRRP